MRFAGTCRRYSNSAMPHEISAAIHHGLPAKFLRCPYQANVMKRFDRVSSAAQASAGCDRTEAANVGMFGRDGASNRGDYRRSAVRRRRSSRDRERQCHGDDDATGPVRGDDAAAMKLGDHAHDEKPEAEMRRIALA